MRTEAITGPLDNENHVAPDYPEPVKSASSKSTGTDNRKTAKDMGNINENHITVLGLSGKDWLLVSLFIVVTAFFIYDRGQLQTQLSLATQSNTELTKELRANTVATDLAKYNAEEVRVQAEVNKGLMAALMCKR